MKLTLDISGEEFDAIVGADMEIVPTIFLNFPSDIQGVYEFELVNSMVNIYDFKTQITKQNLSVEGDSLFVFGKMKVQIDGVKGADFKFTEGDYFTGHEQYYTWPYSLQQGDVICMCGGNLSFFPELYATIIVVATENPKITLTFDTDEAIPIDIFDSHSTAKAHSKATRYENNNSSGKLFDNYFFKSYLSTGRKVIREE
ncbi:hypothetical protein [Paenibacillus senegalimassiliensis]|uniref:hypothetical protein n=1 Tax=Paenibacillus senegalimassiliensis TaxID=1737426 RepID=UPI00073E4C71|nr:hypothetical protein [Paenibacillus senegalimassiliensis]